MLEGVVQIVRPHCDRDNSLPRDRLSNAPPCVGCGNTLFEGRPVPSTMNPASISKCGTTIFRFWYCSTCVVRRKQRSAIDRAAAALEPQARLASIDGAALPDLTERLKVVRYPTLLLLYREGELARATGAMNLAKLLALGPATAEIAALVSSTAAAPAPVPPPTVPPPPVPPPVRPRAYYPPQRKSG